MKNILVLTIIGIVLLVGAVAFLSINKKNKNETNVPLPSETDIVRSFFQLINEHRISEAVTIMNPKITNDDSVKQAWGVQLNAFKKIEITKVEASEKSDWTENKHTYRVDSQVEMKPESVNAPIPYYGWENGANVKWVDIEKVEGKWYINGIASGP